MIMSSVVVRVFNSNWTAAGEPPSIEQVREVTVIPDDPADEVLITGLHWLASLEDYDMLIATYMKQGI